MASILITHGIPLEGFFAPGEHEIIIPQPLQAFTEEEMGMLLPCENFGKVFLVTRDDLQEIQKIYCGVGIL